MFKNGWHIKITLVIVFSFAFYLFWFFIMRDTFWGSVSYKPKVAGYYENLINQQHSPDKDYIEIEKDYISAVAGGGSATTRHYFEINGTRYYVVEDVVYSEQGQRIAGLYPKSEGYFTYLDNLYYVYGEEREKDIITLGGPVSLNTLKDYSYGKLNITELKNLQISKREYEKQYFQIRNNLSQY